MAAKQQVWQNGFEPVGDGAEWDDPIQGRAVSCNIISALSSCGWVCKSRVRQVELTNDTFSVVNDDGSQGGIWVLNAAGVPEEKIVSVSNWLMIENQQLFYGRVDNDAGIFPALYEKLWMRWKVGREIVDFNNELPSTKPQPWPANRRGLLAISGWWNGGAVSYADGWNPWRTIISVCDFRLESGVYKGGGKTKAPMVAWTKDVLSHEDGYNQLLKSHCYSVLGVLNPDDCGGRAFIVLRNPNATREVLASTGAYNSPDIIDGGGRRVPWSDDWQSYEYNVNGVPDLKSDIGVAYLDVDEGIFAIPKQLFASEFQGFGWVGMPLP